MGGHNRDQDPDVVVNQTVEQPVRDPDDADQVNEPDQPDQSEEQEGPEE